MHQFFKCLQPKMIYIFEFLLIYCFLRTLYWQSENLWEYCSKKYAFLECLFCANLMGCTILVSSSVKHLFSLIIIIIKYSLIVKMVSTLFQLPKPY